MAGAYNMIAYGRFSDTERIVVIINNNNSHTKVEIPVWETGMPRTKDTCMTRILQTSAVEYTEERKILPVVGGFVNMEMLPLEAVVLYSCDDDKNIEE